jgi:hypothetical protein
MGEKISPEKIKNFSEKYNSVSKKNITQNKTKDLLNQLEIYFNY